MTCVHCLRRKECAKQRKLMLTVDDIGEYTYQRNVEKDCLNFLDGDAALDLIKRQQAEIERLKSKYEIVYQPKAMIKSEARREFAEIVHGIISPEYGGYHKAIDHLLEEMEKEV